MARKAGALACSSDLECSLMSRFRRSTGAKLALLATLITAAAVAVIFFMVVPQLQARLENQRLSELERVAPPLTPLVARAADREIKASQLDRLVRAIAERSDAVVTLSAIQRGASNFFVLSDSRAVRPVKASPALQRLASQTGRLQGAIVDGPSAKTAQVAIPVPSGHPVWVAVYARDLSDVHGTVTMIGRRVLFAGAIALLVALAGGYLVARRLTARVKRLELNELRSA
jgi:two-component system, OmpR family, sensor kinase